MKKVLSIFLILMILLSISSCSAGKLNIEDRVWKLRYAMHGEDDRVIVDAVGE